MPDPAEDYEAEGMFAIQRTPSFFKRGTAVSVNEEGNTVVAMGSEAGSAAASPRGLAPGPKMSATPRCMEGSMKR